MEPDSELTDTEHVALNQDLDAFFTNEVLSFASDAWIDHAKTKTGYEIPFTKLFYRYRPPRPLEAIDADIKASEQRILSLLAEVTE
jgi:type I restriction enzyme M protein